MKEVFVEISGFSIRYDQDTQCYVSYSPDLDIYSAGRTEEEAIRGAKSAVGMFLRACARKGIILDVLRERGFRQIVDHRVNGFTPTPLQEPIKMTVEDNAFGALAATC